MFAIYFKVYWWIVILFNSWQKIPSEIEKKCRRLSKKKFTEMTLLWKIQNSTGKFLCWYQKLDLISSIHFQRRIFENVMKCSKHFVVDTFPRMRETNFMILPVFQSVLLSGRWWNYYWMKQLKKQTVYMFYTLSGFNLHEKECRGFVLGRLIVKITECENSAFLQNAFD